MLDFVHPVYTSIKFVRAIIIKKLNFISLVSQYIIFIYNISGYNVFHVVLFGVHVQI